VLFALKAAQDANSVTDKDVSELRELGLGDGEFVEVAITVALTRLLNTWATASGIPVDGQERKTPGQPS
jgi:alkylhydroperoxidase family enzyme